MNSKFCLITLVGIKHILLSLFGVVLFKLLQSKFLITGQVIRAGP